MKIGDLFVQLGVSADTFKVKDFKRAIDDLPVSVAGAIVSLAGLSLSFVSLTDDALKMTSTFKIFTAETGMNARALQQWQQVAKQSGVPTEAVTGSMLSLSSMLARVHLGRGIPPEAAQALGRLGLGPEAFGMNANQLMNSIQSGAIGKDPKDVTEWLRALGIAPEMMRVFQTPASTRQRMEPVMSQQAIDQLADFQKELANFNQTVMREFVVVLREFEPYMKDLTQALGFIILHFGGWVAKGIGEDAKLFNEFTKKGVGGTLSDILSSYQSPDNLRDPVVIKQIYSVIQHIHSTSDPVSVAEEANILALRYFKKAAADLDNQGR